MTDTKLCIKIVTKSDFRFLYDLLSYRKPTENISHKKIPTYRMHEKFIKSKPYSKWYIINFNNQKIGSVYLSKMNEIGIHLKDKKYENQFGQIISIIKKKNPRSRYLININPKNKAFRKIIEKNNFKLIQHTYELIEK